VALLIRGIKHTHGYLGHMEHCVMHFTRFWSIVEATHTIQNPTSPQKLDRLIDTLQLNANHTVLDIGCGKGYLLTRMAERCGITGTGIEINPWFCGDARQRSQRAGVDQHITIIESDARDMVLPERQFDAAVCIGATFALGGLLPCLATMRRVVKPGGMIAIGDVFRQQNQLLADMPPHWQALPTMPELIDTIRGNHEAIECIAANLDDWDAYESRKWRTAQAWKARHHDDPEYADFCQMVDDMRREYLVEERPHIGWAIIATINE